MACAAADVSAVRRDGPSPTPSRSPSTHTSIRNDFSWFSGNHGMKFGTNYIHTDLGGYFYFGAFGYELTFFDDPSVITSNRVRYPQGFSTPGAVRLLNYFAGEATHDQVFHQLAFYAQDDWRISPSLTLNLGVRWDANIGLLPDQTNNRTMQLLQQLDDPRAQDIAGDPEKLARTTPGWKEFQPRLGFAYDVGGTGKTVLRGSAGLYHNSRLGGGSLGNLRNPPFISNPILYYGTMGSMLAPGARLADRPVNANGLEPDTKTPSTFSYSVGVGRDIGWGTVVDVGTMRTKRLDHWDVVVRRSNGYGGTRSAPTATQQRTAAVVHGIVGHWTTRPEAYALRLAAVRARVVLESFIEHRSDGLGLRFR